MFRSHNDGSRFCTKAWIVLCLGLFVAMSFAGAARADVMVTVTDGINPLTELSPPLIPPLVVEKAFGTPGVGDGQAFVNSGLARMGASLESPFPNSSQGAYLLEAFLSDRYFFSNLPPGLNTVPAHFDAVGTISLREPDSLGAGSTGIVRVHVGTVGGKRES
jgi:hypothetical protein